MKAVSEYVAAADRAREEADRARQAAEHARILAERARDDAERAREAAERAQRLLEARFRRNEPCGRSYHTMYRQIVLLTECSSAICGGGAAGREGGACGCRTQAGCVEGPFAGEYRAGVACDPCFLFAAHVWVWLLSRFVCCRTHPLCSTLYLDAAIIFLFPSCYT